MPAGSRSSHAVASGPIPIHPARQSATAHAAATGVSKPKPDAGIHCWIAPVTGHSDEEHEMTSILRSGHRRPRLCHAVALIAALLVVPVPVIAGQATAGPAEQVDHYLQMQMDKLRIPGLAVAVVKDGRVVLTRNYGIASVEFAQPVREDTVFAINSVTKAFTGVAAMRLVQQGRLDLAAPVARYLGDLPVAWRGITIRQLLSHMSGLPDVMRAPTVETDAAAAWAWTQQQAVAFPPGQRFSYCQTNYTLIQRVINTIEGRPLDSTLADDQLRLADMTRTFYGDAYDVIPQKAPTYRWVKPTLPVDARSGVASDAPRVMKAASERFLPFRRASSALNSTAADLAQWLIAIDTGRMLTPQARETMWTPVTFASGEKGQWGLGWQVLARGSHRAVGMTGGGRAAVFVYPQDRVGVVILTNLAGSYPEDMVDKVASLYAPGLPLTGVPALRIALEEKGYDRAQQAAAAIEAKDKTLTWSETELNDWGYRLLSTERAGDALAIFQLVVKKFPRSANAEDSLAQAYRAIGDSDAAALHYRRVLQLHPGHAGALRQLAELKQSIDNEPSTTR